MGFSRIPFLALKAVEVAVRHNSYSVAANELGVTHGAVSHHVRKLEVELGVPLFTRQGHSMIPTDAARRLATYAADGFQTLARGIQDIRSTHSRSELLTISVLPALATHWLIPRLTAFWQRFPEIDISLWPTANLADFSSDDIDLALRYGPGGWPGLVAVPWMPEEIFPVCSPSYAEYWRLEAPPDLIAARATGIVLLRDPRQPWRHWFRGVGLGEGLEPDRGPIFGDSGLLLQAAAAGQGVGLAGRMLAKLDLESGRLVRLFPNVTRVRTEFAYFVVYQPGRIPQKVAKFRDWVLSQTTPEDWAHGPGLVSSQGRLEPSAWRTCVVYGAQDFASS